MNHSETLGELFSAMSKAQAAIKKAKRNKKNIHLKNEYADLESVLDAVRPMLSKHGLAVVQQPICTEGHAGVVTWVGHASGEWMSHELVLPMGGRGSNLTQQAGAAISYARRYALSSIFAVAVGDDTDGATEDGPPKRAPKKRAPKKAPPAKSVEPSELIDTFLKAVVPFRADLQEPGDMGDVAQENAVVAFFGGDPYVWAPEKIEAALGRFRQLSQNEIMERLQKVMPAKPTATAEGDLLL
jgi:hypothetical protein